MKAALDGVLEAHATDAETCDVRPLASYRLPVCAAGEVRPFGFGEMATSIVAAFLCLVAAHLQDAALSADQVEQGEADDCAPTEAASATCLVLSSSVVGSAFTLRPRAPRPRRRRGRRR